MIDFWLAAGLLLLVALSFLLIPVLRERRAQREEDRTALNVALYQERWQDVITIVTELEGTGWYDLNANYFDAFSVVDL